MGDNLELIAWTHRVVSLLELSWVFQPDPGTPNCNGTVRFNLQPYNAQAELNEILPRDWAFS